MRSMVEGLVLTPALVSRQGRIGLRDPSTVRFAAGPLPVPGRNGNLQSPPDHLD